MGRTEMRIKVTTGELKSISGEVENQIRNIRELFDNVADIVNRSGSYWEGDGQLAYVHTYRSRSDAIERVLKRFEEHVTDLRTIAGVYEEAEAAAEETAASLSCDIII